MRTDAQSVLHKVRRRGRNNRGRFSVPDSVISLQLFFLKKKKHKSTPEETQINAKLVVACRPHHRTAVRDMLTATC
jgi:hypothetical protein